MAKKHILDTVGQDEINNAFEWDLSIWEVQLKSGSSKLLVKPGELEQALLETCALNEYPNEIAMIRFRAINIKTDLPIKDFTGF